jgi:hypothetical protein
MTMPLITKESVMAYLQVRLPTNPPVEVIGVYPHDDSVIKYGVYVRNVNTASREPFQIGVTYSGSIYTKTDTFEIVYVSFQDDPQNLDTRSVIEGIASNVDFLDGYHEADFTTSVQIGNRSEKYTYNFSLKRLDFNDPATI